MQAKRVPAGDAAQGAVNALADAGSCSFPAFPAPANSRVLLSTVQLALS